MKALSRCIYTAILSCKCAVKVRSVNEASVSIRNSVRLKKVLELILALGNYMNSNRKGVAAGFKIQSLSRVSCMFLRLVT